ncbi:MAG: family 16 glycosylhydrolase [Clostridia bacterium]|nr:family 16 glycosylhydrolase [Clostridia bacterium]
MRSVKKIVSIVLVLALCFLIGGCSKKPPKKQQQIVTIPYPNQGETDDGNQNGEDNVIVDDAYISDRELADKTDAISGEVEPEFKVKVADFKVTSDYTVIYPNGNTQLKQAAEKLVKYFADNGVKVGISADTAAKKDKEILLGDTNRKKSTLAENKYAVTVSGKNLIFESGNFNGAVKAVNWFTSLKYADGKANTLTGEYEFASQIQREDGKYNYVWGDEFDGNLLDDKKWELTSAISAESSFKLSRDPKAIKVQDGLLKLSAQRFFDPDNNQIQAIAPYTVDSKSKMNFQYGYLEMRARIPLRDGAWPSLWMSGACKTGAVVSDLFTNGDIIPSNFSAEADIIEYTSLQPNLHKWFYEEQTASGIVNKHSSLGAVETPVKHPMNLDPANSFVYQIIGYEWTPEKMTIYVNGEVFYTYNWTTSVQLDGLKDMSDFLNPMFVRINNHLLPKNIPSDYSTLPAEFFVDYVRIYQKDGVGGIWLAD